MADTGTPDDRTDASPAQEFPHKMRVHALARMIGLTSREVLAHLAELGISARSPQSSIDRSAAVAVRDAHAAQGAGAPADVPSDASSSTADPAEAPVTAPAAETATAEDTTPSLFSAAVSEEAVPTTPAADSGVSPLFLPPPDPDEVRRTRRRRPAAGSSSEATADAPASTGDTATDPGASDSADSSASDSTGSTSSAPDSSDTDGDDNGSGGGRRRRRGRRGRGRGRGDQGDGEGSNDSSSEDSADESSTIRGEGSSKDSDAGSGDTRSHGGTKSDGKDTEGTESGDTDRTDDTAGDTGSAEKGSDDSEKDDDSDDESSSGSRRRRRRRRRKGGGESDDSSGGEDDPPNTVVHEREPRNKSRSRDRDEVQGISGSTRLEAKRQRRRDGRDAGRRRPPILTESEFLARRESVDRVMVVRERAANTTLAADDADGAAATEDYTQVAVLEDGVLVEHFVTTSTSSSMVGNIFLGRVQNVLPGMEAAFVDIGRGRNGVLYAGEVNWDAAGLDGGSRKIEQALKPGDTVVVQVSKDPVGHKGARLTTQISLAGRYLVYVPGGSSTGISRKLPDTERKRLKQILGKVVPADAGVIIRTASEGVSEEDLAGDIERLKAQWESIESAASSATGKGGKGSGSSAPKALYSEPDLLVKVVRDLFNEDFSSLVIDGDGAWDQVRGYVESVAPDLLDRLSRFEKAHADAPDAFSVHRIDEQLAKALERKVWLPSGGTLIIEHTEAMTVVDVNTGKFTGSGGNLEETVTRNNLEAAEEIVRQMRLRDIGGMIIVDFIDMVLESNRDLVLRRLTEALSRDRTRHQVSEVTSLGLVQMTRKRLGTGLLEAFSSPCTCCNGRGIVVHANPVEVSGAGDDGKDSGGGKRSRRSGRKKSENGSSEQSDTKKSAKPAEHPMFRAMAGHADESDGPADESSPHEAPSTTGTATEDVVAGTEPLVEDTAPEPIADAEPAETRATHAPVTPAESAPDTPAEPAADTPAEPAADTPAEPAADTPAEPAPDTSDSAAGAPKRRRRAARRPASAPVGGAEPVTGTAEALAVEVSHTPTTTVAAQPTVDGPVVAVRRTARRRAAGRPAGPPVEE